MPRVPWAFRAKRLSRQSSVCHSKASYDAVSIASSTESHTTRNAEIAETKLGDKYNTIVDAEPTCVEIIYDQQYTEIESKPVEITCERCTEIETKPQEELVKAAQEMRDDDEETVIHHERGEEPQDSIEITDEQYLECNQIVQDPTDQVNDIIEPPMDQVNDIIEPSSSSEISEERTPADAVVEWTEVLVYNDLGSVNEKKDAVADLTAEQTRLGSVNEKEDAMADLTEEQTMQVKGTPEEEKVVPPTSDEHRITRRSDPVDLDELSSDDGTEADESDNSENGSVTVATADDTHPFRKTLMELQAIAEDIRFIMNS